MSNYGEFKIASRTRINLPQDKFMNGPWVHLATVTRGLREYVILLKNDGSSKIYLEEITPTGLFKQIEDEELWKDLLSYSTSKGLTSEVSGSEIIVAR